MTRSEAERAGSARGPRARTVRIAIGFLAGCLPVLAIWLVEPLPPDPRQALALVPSSLASYLVPAAVAVLVAARLGGSGLAGTLAGAVAGFWLAAMFVGPTYRPHPWDELDGVWHTWFSVAGARTLAATAVVVVVAWSVVGAAGLANRHRIRTR